MTKCGKSVAAAMRLRNAVMTGADVEDDLEDEIREEDEEDEDEEDEE